MTTATHDTLAIRWFTPRGRTAREEVLRDLRHDDGSNLHEILEGMRREGVGLNFLDMRGIDLSGEDLAGYRLLDADFSGANLDGCNFSHANLTGSRFVNASLEGANLKGCSLTRCDLSGANFTEADLSEALIDEANVRGTRLIRTRMTRTRALRVQLTDARIREVDLSSVQKDRLPPTTRRHRVTKPPSSEIHRFPTRKVVRATAPATRRHSRPLPPEKRVRPTGPVGDARYSSFDSALAALSCMRDVATAITVQVGGKDVVLWKSGSGVWQIRAAA
jgi:hypothetical protein